MYSYYKLDILPIILNRFKVKKVILCGLSDDDMLSHIFSDNDNLHPVLNSKEDFEFENIDDNVLDVLHDLMDYDAIFLNDDPNWYTVYNELNIIKRNNEEFPLVFICHNIFPHKRRDSYKDPNIIPEDFRNESSKELKLGNIIIKDNFYHAINENTAQNGVLTAIGDFLKENTSIVLMNIKFLNGLTILYNDNSISRIRLSKLFEEIECYELSNDEIQDNVVENNFFKNYFFNLDILKNNDSDILDIKDELVKKEKTIKDYENKIQIHDAEISFKNSQIENVSSELALKETQIKDIESKLTNRENEISDLADNISFLENKLILKDNDLNKNESKYNADISEAYSKITLLKKDISQREKKELELNNELQNANNQIKINSEQLNDKDYHISFKNNLIQIKEHELNEKELMLNSIKRCYARQLSKIDSKEYCISCYKEEINNNKSEIHYLKRDSLTRKLFSPLAYICLIFKSNPNELSINFKLYKAIKNSKCFDIGYYLANNSDIQESKWCKFFSPELHYVCKGFGEKRKFNKKYFNRKSKKELLEYIINCS